jgi:hypothetical protein
MTWSEMTREQRRRRERKDLCCLLNEKIVRTILKPIEK